MLSFHSVSLSHYVRVVVVRKPPDADVDLVVADMSSAVMGLSLKASGHFCQPCDRGFDTARGLKIHISRMHRDQLLVISYSIVLFQTLSPFRT